jgi:hypothetical protein
MPLPAPVMSQTCFVVMCRCGLFAVDEVVSVAGLRQNRLPKPTQFLPDLTKHRRNIHLPDPDER